MREEDLLAAHQPESVRDLMGARVVRAGGTLPTWDRASDAIAALLVGVTLSSCSLLHQGSENFGGLPARNDCRTWPCRLSGAVSASDFGPDSPATRFPSYIVTGEACDTRNDYGVVNEEGQFIARIQGSCDISSP